MTVSPGRSSVPWSSWAPRPLADLPEEEVSLLEVDETAVLDLARSRLDVVEGALLRFLAAPAATSTGAPVRVILDLDGMHVVDGEEHLVELSHVSSIERRGEVLRLEIDGLAVVSLIADTATLRIEELSSRRPPHLLVSSDYFWADTYVGVWDLATADEFEPQLVDPRALDISEELAARITAWSEQGQRGARGTSWRNEQQAISHALQAALPGATVRTTI